MYNNIYVHGTARKHTSRPVKTVFASPARKYNNKPDHFIIVLLAYTHAGQKLFTIIILSSYYIHSHEITYIRNLYIHIYIHTCT